MSQTWVTQPVTPAPSAPNAPPPIPLPQPGDVYLRFQVLDVLGSGGMGVVLLARDPELERNVAIKLVSSPSARLSTRLLREAKAMAQLRHPNVVAVFEAGIDEQGRVYMVMEVGRETLRQLHRRQPRPWRQLIDLFVEAGQGLAAAHAAGFVHRDFKPDNVFVGQDGRACVGDFGLVSAESGVPTPGHASPVVPALFERELVSEAVGTPPYMAPEQYWGRAVDARGDQFSFCVALWEALYGQMPFAGKNCEEYIAAVEQNELREPPADTQVPSWVRDVLARGLRADPNQRFANMQALLHEFAPNQFARGPHLHIFALLVVAFTCCPISTFFFTETYTTLIISELVILVSIVLFGFFAREMIMRSTFNWLGFRLMGVGIVSLLMLCLGGYLCGLSVDHVTALNPLFQGVIAMVAAFTLELDVAAVAALYVLAYFGYTAYPPSGPFLLAIANASMGVVAILFWRPRHHLPNPVTGAAGVVLAAGERIGRFQVVRVLREGKEDSLVEANDPRLRRKVTLQVGGVGLREARGLAGLSHRNLLTVYQVGFHDSRPYVAYEWVSGRTLRQELDEHKELDWRTVVDHFVAAGRGLSAGHRAGFVHGTFSTDRVFVEQGGRVLLGGFGFRPPGGTTSATAPRRR